MHYDLGSNLIQLSFLKQLQDTFHKDVCELVDFYLDDAKKKLDVLNKSLKENNLSHFRTAAKELRRRSIDVGAIRFSHLCLSLEIATQEMRLEALPPLTDMLKEEFEPICTALFDIKEAAKKERTLTNFSNTPFKT